MTVSCEEGSLMIKSSRHPESEQSSAEFLASVVRSTEDAIVTQTFDGVITSWNLGAEKVYGFTLDEAIGKPVSLLAPEGRADDMAAFVRRIAEGETIPHFETVRRRKDGRIISVSMSVSGLKDGKGRTIGASSIARDISALITARRTAAEQLNRASQYARSLIESSLDPLITISADGKITDVNEATVRVTGVPREDLIGTDFSNYFTEPAKASEGYQQVFARGFVTDYPLTIRHRDGHFIDVLYNASVYRDAKGDVIGVFAAARDVTARKRAEEELAEQRRRELDRLADLEKFQRLTVGRELKMVELKKEIEALRQKLETLRTNTPEHA